MLENELLSLERCKREFHIAKDELILSLKREESVNKLLTKEHEIISKWTESAKVSEHIRNVQGKINFLDEDHVDVPSVDSESNDDNASMDKNYPLTLKESTNKNYPSNKGKSIDNKDLRKLKKKYCHLDKFVPKKEIEIEIKTKA